MLNIADLPVTNIKVSNDGYDDYTIHLRIIPTESEEQWLPLTSGGWCGCRSYGGQTTGKTLKFSSAKDAIRFIKEEYGRYGISLLVDQDLRKVDVSKFLDTE